jgi:hypothetical protein
MAFRSSHHREKSLTSNVIDLSEFAYDGEEEDLEVVAGETKAPYPHHMGKTSSDPIFFGSGTADSAPRGLVISDVASPIVVTKRYFLY